MLSVPFRQSSRICVRNSFYDEILGRGTFHGLALGGGPLMRLLNFPIVAFLMSFSFSGECENPKHANLLGSAKGFICCLFNQVVPW